MAQQNQLFQSQTMVWPLLRWSSVMVCCLVLGGAVILQLALPPLELDAVSPMNLLLAFCISAGLINASKRAVVERGAGSSLRYWLLVITALLVICFAEVVDLGLDGLELLLSWTSSDNAPELILASVGVLLLTAAPFFAVPQPQRYGLAALAAFCLVSALPALLDDQTARALGISEVQFDLLIEAPALMFMGLFLAATMFRSMSDRSTWMGTGLLGRLSSNLRGGSVGSSSRQMFFNGGVALSPRHPPLSIAFRPGFQDVTFYLVMFGMLLWAGGHVRRGTGRGYLQQTADMVRLWYVHRIEPPTYYALEMFRPENSSWAPRLLTRFETKNGLLSAMNRFRPNPLSGHEMNDKELFAKVCQENCIPHPETLMLINGPSTEMFVLSEALQRDLFCKPRKTMGAKDTLSFRWLGGDKYQDQHGTVLDIFGVCATVALKKKPMLVQPWLQNHVELFGLAKDSLMAVRVVTVLNARDEPEVTLAMLRLLAKLEPDWHDRLPDGEYAAPIDIVTGKLGLFTGDNFKTALVRMTHHPITGAAIDGRVLENWPKARDLALKAHNAVKHRVIVGWDIAVTPEGPVMLEGNTNLDVMFLQRVHDCPAGDTRFGELMNYQVNRLFQSLQG